LIDQSIIRCGDHRCIARGPFGARGPWHSAKVPPPKDGPTDVIIFLPRSLEWLSIGLHM